jgi:two-component system, OmpR family, response regulator MprA
LIVSILVLDDDASLRTALERVPTDHALQVCRAEDGPEALAERRGPAVGAVVLDVMMPGLDGKRFCQQRRVEGSTVAVLTLTARDGIGDRVVGLDPGADDCRVQPLANEELLARSPAPLRRAGSGGEGLSFADLELDLLTRDARDRPPFVGPTGMTP